MTPTFLYAAYDVTAVVWPTDLRQVCQLEQMEWQQYGARGALLLASRHSHVYALL